MNPRLLDILVCPLCMAQYNIDGWTQGKPAQCQRCRVSLQKPESLKSIQVQEELRVTTSGNASRYATNGGTTSITVPVSVSLVTPIMPPTDVPSNDIMIIPAVAHADGNNSRWQSDVRVAHTYPTTVRYRLAFTPTGSDASSEPVSVNASR